MKILDQKTAYRWFAAAYEKVQKPDPEDPAGYIDLLDALAGLVWDKHKKAFATGSQYELFSEEDQDELCWYLVRNWLLRNAASAEQVTSYFDSERGCNHSQKHMSATTTKMCSEKKAVRASCFVYT